MVVLTSLSRAACMKAKEMLILRRCPRTRQRFLLIINDAHVGSVTAPTSHMFRLFLPRF